MNAKSPKDSKSAIDLATALQGLLNNAIKKAVDPSETTETIWEGTQIKLPAEPERMPRRTAIGVLLDQEAAENQEYDLFERIPGMPFDAAAAFIHVLKERYGWVAATTKQTMFGPQPPRMQVVKTGPNPEDYIEVPVGQFKLHDISTMIETGFTQPLNSRKSQFMDFYIKAEVNYIDRKVIMNLIEATRRHLENHSIYKNKPMQLSVDEDGNLDALIEPVFMDLSKVNKESLVLNDDVQALVDVALLTPIRRTESCRKHKIPLKRGILLEGPYGTGKSFTALVTAVEAIENGWTFVMVDNVTALAATLQFAKQFQPCVVFAEDIDRIVDKDRTEEANDIINTIDGIVGKSDEVITVLTTNHLDKLPPVMLRPGRLDALVPISVPDAKAALRLIRQYGGPLIGVNDPLTGLADVVAGFLPSTVREVVERAKLSMLMHDRKHLTVDDLRASALGLKVHADLLKEQEVELTPEEEFGVAFKKLLNGHGGGEGPDLGDVRNRITEVRSEVRSRVSNVAEDVGKIKRMMEQQGQDGPLPQLNEIIRDVRAVKARVGA